MKLKYRIMACILALSLALSLISCDVLLTLPDIPGTGESGGAGSGTGEGGGQGSGTGGGQVVFPDGEETPPDEWDDKTAALYGATPVYLTIGETADLTEYLDLDIPSEGLDFESRCDEIASVSGSVVTGNAVGRTQISVSLEGEAVALFSVTVEFMISTTGYDFTTDLSDGNIYEVESVHQANGIIDYAIAKRYHSVSIDFSKISPSFDVVRDFDLDIQLGTHVKLKILYYESTPYKAVFELVYNQSAASSTTPLTAGNTYAPVASANAIARRAYAEAAGEERADNFNDFKIYENNLGEHEVYNSEELWWAVERGYLPVFPMEHTKAELFFERAKMILREIIYEGMSDYDKVAAIYEYLVDAVSYDYDAYAHAGEVTAGGNADAIDALKNDTCYYLEGVFERGRAVCDGKTKAFVLLCGIEGIVTLRTSGSSLDGGIGHAWNYVNIDGYWYLVDTTEGDARYTVGSNIASFFGESVETVGYGAFLKPVDYHKSRYEYSEVWREIEEYELVGTLNYFETKLMGTGYDFTLDSVPEVEAIFDAAVDFGLPTEFTLIFIPADEGNVFSYFRTVREIYGLDMQLFTLQYGGEKVYIALFSAELR